MKLHLGCGPTVLPDWINIDYSLGARIAKIPVLGGLSKSIGLFNVQWDPRIVLLNLTKPLPYADSSVDFIYSSHTLEHLRREDGLKLMGECARVLKPGGTVRIVVPCLERIIGKYQAGELLSENLLEHLLVLPDRNMSLQKKVAFGLFDDGHMHKCMYDHAGMKRLMESAGLKASARQPFDSAIPDIREIESLNRAENQVVVEGTKPQ